MAIEITGKGEEVTDGSLEAAADAMLAAGAPDHFLEDKEDNEWGVRDTPAEGEQSRAVEIESPNERDARIAALEQGEPEPTKETKTETETETKTETETETETETQTEEETPAPGAEETEAADPPIEKLTELAEALETPLEQLRELKVSVNDSEGEKEVSLTDLAESYERQGDYTRKTQELSQERTEFSERQQTYQLDAQKAAVSMGASFDALEGSLTEKLESPEMAQLKAGDVDDYREYQNRKDAIEGEVHGIRDARQKAGEAYDGWVAKQYEDFVMGQYQILSRDVDGGFDGDKLKTAVAEFEDMGFAQHEMRGLMDARFIKWGLERSALRAENAQLKTQSEKGVKDLQKVKKTLPTLNPAGKNKGKKTGKVDKYAAAAARLGKRTAENRGVSHTEDVVDTFEAALDAET